MTTAENAIDYSGESQGMRQVVVASSLGTLFEFYDFFLYGALAAYFGKLFFPPGNETAGFLASLATFGAGFAVRPLGAIVFGRIGDLVGRKYCFLVTMVLMGASTGAVGLLPTYDHVGMWAPAMLVSLRLLQGLAIGGEYGGAAIYVAEHSPITRRGYATSWIQTTATVGLIAALVVIAVCRATLSNVDFEAWGWRIPFLISALLLAVSIYVRMRLAEPPTFLEMKRQGALCQAPVTESFGRWSNLRFSLLALFGITAGQGVLWYTAHFYTLYFLTVTLKVDSFTTYVLIAIAVALATPLYVVFGALSDRVGRKPIMMAGCLLGAVSMFSIFNGLSLYGNPALRDAQQREPVTVAADNCHFNLFTKPASACDLARDFLSRAGIAFTTLPGVAGEAVITHIGSIELKGFDARAYGYALGITGYPDAADALRVNKIMIVAMVFLLTLFVTMVYGPMAAYLVEMFPAHIRYTSLSLPYHLGSGWFGGLLPFISFATVVHTGNIYAGLWYPVGMLALTFVVGSLFLPARRP